MKILYLLSLVTYLGLGIAVYVLFDVIHYLIRGVEAHLNEGVVFLFIILWPITIFFIPAMFLGRVGSVLGWKATEKVQKKITNWQQKEKEKENDGKDRSRIDYSYRDYCRVYDHSDCDESP